MSIFSAYKDWVQSREDNEHVKGGLTSLNLKAIPYQIGSGGQGYGGYGGGTYFYNFPNTKINFAQEVGNLRQSSLFMAAVGWLSRSLYDARLRVIQKSSDQKEQEIDEHELAVLFDRPNDFYSGQALLSGFALSWISRSECYFLKERGGFNNVLHLWWEPNDTIRPRWDMNGNDFISYYEILRNGTWRRIEVEDVIAIRNGVDPDTRRGLLNPEAALLREYYTDNQISQLCATMFKKGLVPPVVMGLGDKDFHPAPEQVTAFKADVNRSMSGDNAGNIMVTAGAVTAQKLGVDYKSIGFREVRQMPEARFCSVMGISGHSLNLDVAQKASTDNNVDRYLRQDYRNYVVPVQKLIGKEMTVQALPDYGDTKKKAVTWDYSQTYLMSSDKTVETDNATKIWEKNGIDRAEYREAIGYKMRDEDKGVYYVDVSKKEEPDINQPIPADIAAIADATAKSVVKKLGYSDKDLDESAESWRNHEALTPLQQSFIDAKPYVNGKAS